MRDEQNTANPRPVQETPGKRSRFALNLPKP